MFDIFNPLVPAQNAYSLAEAAMVAGFTSPVEAGVNWNNLLSRGLYAVVGAGVNSPSIGNSWQPSFPGFLRVERTGDLMIQTYMSLGGQELMCRTTGQAGVFSSWRLLAAKDRPNIKIYTSEDRTTSGVFSNFNKVTNSYGLTGFNEASGSFTAPFTGLYSYELTFTIFATPAEGSVQVAGFSQSFTGNMQTVSLYHTEFLDAAAGQSQNFNCVLSSGALRLSLGKITFLG